jgi:ubiquinone/menaquinone biosynthesis C-methylase UbiE
MFTKTAAFYDLIYHWKNYPAETDKLLAFIQQHKRSSSSTLLDVGCGTGKHLEHLRAHFACEGLDLDPELLKVAQERLPDLPLHHADMLNFDLGRSFDVVVCLFGAVAYMQSLERYQAAVANMAGHVAPGGLLIVEPFLFKEDFTPGKITVQTGEAPGLAIARMTDSRVKNGTTYFVFNYLDGTSDGVQHLEESHVLGIFTWQEYADALQAHCSQVIYNDEGLMGRGLFVGVK